MVCDVLSTVDILKQQINNAANKLFFPFSRIPASTVYSSRAVYNTQGKVQLCSVNGVSETQKE